MPPDLAAFEAAYDRVERQLRRARQGDRFVRRRLRRPVWSLWGTLALIVVTAGSSLVGVDNGWMVAVGLCLAVLPDRLAAVRRRRQALAAMESADDIRALVHGEAQRRMAGAFLGSLLMGALGLLYVLTGGVAWLLDRSPWPGLAAGSIVLVWSAVELLVVLPRAAREARLFDDGRTTGDDGDA